MSQSLLSHEDKHCWSIACEIRRANVPINFRGILQQQQQLEQMIKIVLIVFSVLIGLISCGSIIVGIWAFIRCNGYPRVESVGKWRLLAEDFKAYV